MLRGIPAPQITQYQQVVLSPRQRFDWGKSDLAFTPTQPFDIGKPPESAYDKLDEMAKAVKEQRKLDIEEAKLENERRRRDEAERHNKAVERIRAASEGVGTSKGGGGGGEAGGEGGVGAEAGDFMDDSGAMKQLRGLYTPNSEDATGRYFRDVKLPDLPTDEPPVERVAQTETAPAQTPVADKGVLANVEPIQTEEVGTPEDGSVVCDGEGKCEPAKQSVTNTQVQSISRGALLSGTPSPKIELAPQPEALPAILSPKIGEEIQKKTDSIFGIDKPLQINQKKPQIVEPQNIASQKRVEENKIEFKENKAPLAGIKLEPYDVPYNRFVNPDIARAYSKAVMIGTPTLKANPPVPIRDRKGKIAGYTVKWEDNTEAVAKKEERLAAALERTNKFEADQAAKRAKLIMMEGRAVQAQDALRNYVRSNGLREALARFIPAYETASSDNGGNKGVSDVDLIDTYGRAMGGGKITEAQSNLIKDSKTLKEKAEVVFGKNFGAGDRLSQSQRDQMLRNMLEAHNVQADIANNVLNVARERLLAEGIKDERFLPQQFTSGLKLKVDARNEVNRLENAQKNLRLSAESAASNKLLSQEQKIAQLRKIKEQTADYQHEIESIKKQLDDEEYSGSEILNLKRFKQGKGGFIAGGGTAVEAEVNQ